MVDLEAIFPKLRGAPYTITSPPTQDYNCIAWAAGDTQRWWWPDVAKLRYWPVGVPRQETLSAFQQAFETLGFVVGADESLELGIEKIVIFADNDGPQHAARQLANGRWTSKLGELEDIEHDLRDLEGADYGLVAVIMQRPMA